MPDLTEHLEASAAFTKATGVVVEHGWDESGTGGFYNYYYARVPKNATNRDLSVWAWRQLEGILRHADSADDTDMMIGFDADAFRLRPITSTDTEDRYPDLEAAVLAATKKIGGLA